MTANSVFLGGGGGCACFLAGPWNIRITSCLQLQMLLHHLVTKKSLNIVCQATWSHVAMEERVVERKLDLSKTKKLFAIWDYVCQKVVFSSFGDLKVDVLNIYAVFIFFGGQVRWTLTSYVLE